MITKWPNAMKLTNTAAAFIYLMVVLGGAGSGLSASTTTTKSDQKWPATKCAMSEYTCTNGKCIQLNKYCDKINDCGDSSDEPRFCTRKYFMIAPSNHLYPLWNRLLDKTFVWIWLRHPAGVVLQQHHLKRCAYCKWFTMLVFRVVWIFV